MTTVPEKVWAGATVPYTLDVNIGEYKYVDWKIFVEEYFAFKKVCAKVVDAYPRIFFNIEIIFNSPCCI